MNINSLTEKEHLNLTAAIHFFSSLLEASRSRKGTNGQTTSSLTLDRIIDVFPSVMEGLFTTALMIRKQNKQMVSNPVYWEGRVSRITFGSLDFETRQSILYTIENARIRNDKRSSFRPDPEDYMSWRDVVGVKHFEIFYAYALQASLGSYSYGAADDTGPLFEAYEEALPNLTRDGREYYAALLNSNKLF